MLTLKKLGLPTGLPCLTLKTVLAPHLSSEVSETEGCWKIDVAMKWGLAGVLAYLHPNTALEW